MLTELITLPLRATRLWLRGAEQVLGLARQMLGDADGGTAGRDSHRTPGARPAPRPAPGYTQPGPERSQPEAPSSQDRPSAAPRVSAAPEPTPRHEPAPQPEPRHVSEEPTLVEEAAEPGAEAGAGAQINVEEPWPGYQQMSARDILNRLDAASPEALAAVQLYERAHRARQTVLNEAERRLRSAASGVGSRT